MANYHAGVACLQMTETTYQELTPYTSYNQPTQSYQSQPPQPEPDQPITHVNPDNIYINTINFHIHCLDPSPDPNGHFCTYQIGLEQGLAV